MRSVAFTRVLSATFRRFAASCDGNIGIMFGLSSLVMAGAVGAATDYSRANSVKAYLQAALDSTALMLSKEAGFDTTAQLQTNATAYFKANFTRPGITDIQVTPTYTTTGGTKIVLNGSAKVPTAFAGILGLDAITISTTSTVKWGSSRLRVALVLDNTGSMAQSGKIAALQTATKNLLNQLQAATVNAGDVYVSIIPFAKDVNVDPANYSATWIDWTSWNAANGSCSNGTGSTQYACTGHWTPAAHSSWNGCVVDRGGTTGPDPADYDTNVVAPSTSITATLFSAEQYSSCPQAAMGLNYNWSAMATLVNNMSPGGNTNQAIGLALGWMSLTGGGPFVAPAMSPNYTYKNIIILLTDGLNTQDRWYSYQSRIDSRQTLTCNNIKASGVTLYTVQVSTDNTPVSPLLQQCASDSTKFFYLTSAAQIVTAFSSIGTNLSNLYVAN